MPKLDTMQRRAADLYQKQAQMQLFDDEPTMEQVMTNQHGDTLFTFIMCEAAGVEAEELRERLLHAANELVMLADALEVA